MEILRVIGIPVRFFFYILFHIVLGLLEPGLLANQDNDWQWVITGVDKYQRGKEKCKKL